MQYEKNHIINVGKQFKIILLKFKNLIKFDVSDKKKKKNTEV